MKYPISAAAALLAFAILLAACAPTHRLADVPLEGASVAVMAPLPPAHRLVTGPWPYAVQPAQPPPGELRRRFEASRAAQTRLDSAASLVDVGEVVARQTLTQAGRLLRLRPQDDPEAAEFVLDVRLLELSFTATSFDHAVRAFVETDVMLFRQDTREVLWQRRFRDRLAVDPALFDAPEFGQRLTPRDMTRLSTERFALGIERLARQAGDQVARQLAQEYRGARRR